MNRLIRQTAFSFVFICLFFFGAQAQVRSYQGYKNIKKKKTLLLPFKSLSLSGPVTKMLDENLITEIVKPGVHDIINRYPGFDVEMALNQPLGADIDLYKLSETADFEYIILPRIEKEGDRFRVTADLVDVRRITVLAGYTRECACPFEDVVFLILPELSEKVSKTKFELDTECPSDMVTFQKASYAMGSPDKYDNNPEITARVNNFCMDRNEYPNKLGAEPLVDITWNSADSACRSKGKRLCSEFEWEYACRGKFNYYYPYGNQYKSGACNTESKELKPAGSFLDCRSEANIYDMSGNVNEWTGSNWDANIRNKVIRGGAYFSGEKDSKCTLRFSNRPNTKARAIGFRCCRSIN
ncbi:MAG: SUMF1/EgtB/PvdO family nonheme iron enzyme [Fibrobacterota bacterium]